MNDVNPLSGDPTLTFDEREWCADMLNQMMTGSLNRTAQLWEEMTDDERDMLRRYEPVSDEQS